LFTCLQHLTEIRKVISPVGNSEEMLGCLNKIENFLAKTHCQHRNQTKIYVYMYVITYTYRGVILTFESVRQLFKFADFIIFKNYGYLYI
jgi:hypothetical protein